MSICEGSFPYFFNYVISEESKTMEKVKKVKISWLPVAGEREKMKRQNTEEF